MVALIVAQILVSLILIVSILIQANGLGVGRSFGGSSVAYHTKRGAEKALFYTTIICSVLFLVLSLLNLSLGK